jgi:hypothetical protein
MALAIGLIEGCLHAQCLVYELFNHFVPHLAAEAL